MHPSHFAAAPALAAISALATRRGLTVDDLVEHLGLHRRAFYRTCARDRWRWDVADQIAVALGKHPCELWPDWFG